MTGLLMLLAGFAAAYLLQLHVLPILGWIGSTPELLFTACAVGSMSCGSNRTLPFALLFGAAADLSLGYGYGMFLLPMTAAAFFFQPLWEKASEKPYLAAPAVGAAAIAARLFRSCLLVFLGRGFFPAGAEWFSLLLCGIFSALTALVTLYAADRRSRHVREGRFRL